MLVSHNKTKVLKGFHEVSGHMLLLGLMDLKIKLFLIFSLPRQQNTVKIKSCFKVNIKSRTARILSQGKNEDEHMIIRPLFEISEIF